MQTKEPGTPEAVDVIRRDQLPGDELPSQKGSYILVLSLEKRFSTEVGRLGMCEFPTGRYLYVGSAFGPGGIAARCRRHLRKEKKLHWHIDHLTARASIHEILYAAGDRPLEERWVSELSDDARFGVPHSGFGASDSNASSHLFYSPCREQFEPTGVAGRFLPLEDASLPE